MAQGSIRTRCSVCRKAGLAEAACTTHPERVYQAMHRDPSGRQCGKTFAKKKDAERFLAGETSKIYDGTYKRITPATFSDVADAWLARKKPVWRPATYTTIKYALDKHIRPALGDWKISAIGSADVARVQAKLSAGSFSLRRCIKQTMQSIFRQALFDKQIAEDPTRQLEIVKNIKPSTPKILTTAQAKSLIEVAGIYNSKTATGNRSPKSSYGAWRRSTIPLYYRLAIFAGLRPEEICGLKWEDIDFEERELSVKRSVYYFHTRAEQGTHKSRWVFQDCKTRAAYRTIPIEKNLFGALQVHQIESKENPSGFVLTRFDGINPVNHCDIRNHHFNEDLKRASCPKIRFYDLRHTFCSFLLASGLKDLKRLQYLMGHERFETTMNIYAHIVPTSDRALIEGLERFVNDRVNTVSTE